MIILKDKVDCCGCTSCQAVCPVSCISMNVDSEGFRYPVTDTDACINCNSCNRVCPVINKDFNNIPFENSDFYAAQIFDNDVLMRSSSGGVFSMLASKWIMDGGVVFGAAWVMGEVRHIEVNTLDGLNALRGSKYVQSSLGDTFKKIKELLDLKRKVLFSGTPCQVDGLNRYLKINQPLLLTVEVSCHGVPSPLVLRKYLNELGARYSTNVSLNFRDKSKGWMHYCVKAENPDGEVLFCENHKDNCYMQGFLHELYSRPSCSQCPSKGGASKADFTLCDFWGIEKICPNFGFDNGISLMIANTDFAKKFIKKFSNLARLQNVSSDSAILYNSSLVHSTAMHPDRKYFFRNINKSKNISHLIAKCLKIRKSVRLKLTFIAYIKRLNLWK